MKTKKTARQQVRQDRQARTPPSVCWTNMTDNNDDEDNTPKEDKPALSSIDGTPTRNELQRSIQQQTPETRNDTSQNSASNNMAAHNTASTTPQMQIKQPSGHDDQIQVLKQKLAEVQAQIQRTTLNISRGILRPKTRIWV